MNGYGSHTFTWVNADGEAFYVKYHFKTDQGIENLTDDEAAAMAAEIPTTTAATCEMRSRGARGRRGRSRCRSCRLRRRRTTGSIRSI